MTPVGYMYKFISPKPDWLKTASVLDIYSLSNCVSDAFTDFINYWLHNGYWLFNTPEIMEEIAARENLDLSSATLFYYEAYEFEYDEDINQWKQYSPDTDFVTDIVPPLNKHLKGFDVTTFSLHNSPECSPLSCNHLAEQIYVNKHCLFNSFDDAKEAIEQDFFKNSEPGPYRIFAVYTIQSGSQLT